MINKTSSLNEGIILCKLQVKMTKHSFFNTKILFCKRMWSQTDINTKLEQNYYIKPKEATAQMIISSKITLQ